MLHDPSHARHESIRLEDAMALSGPLISNGNGLVISTACYTVTLLIALWQPLVKHCELSYPGSQGVLPRWPAWKASKTPCLSFLSGTVTGCNLVDSLTGQPWNPAAFPGILRVNNRVTTGSSGDTACCRRCAFT